MLCVSVYNDKTVRNWIYVFILGPHLNTGTPLPGPTCWWFAVAVGYGSALKIWFLKRILIGWNLMVVRRQATVSRTWSCTWFKVLLLKTFEYVRVVPMNTTTFLAVAHQLPVSSINDFHRPCANKPVICRESFIDSKNQHHHLRPIYSTDRINLSSWRYEGLLYGSSCLRSFFGS